jgi:hypothetical protein
MKMNLRKWNFAPVFLIGFLALTGFSQVEPKPVLVDEFSRVPCDELGSRASGLVQEIWKSSGSRALVIFYPKATWRSLVIQQFRQILAQFEFAELEDNVYFVIGETRNDAKIEFWKIPMGATEPAYAGEKWILPKSDLSRPFMYDTEDENGECPTFVLRKFAELILNNPRSRANIVVRKGGSFSSSGHGFANEWVNDLTSKFGIPRKRIRIFYAKDSQSSLTYAEFWFVPAKLK